MLQETITQDALLQEVTLAPRSGEMVNDTTSCPNCKTIKIGHYCHQCGAEGIDRHELSLKHFLHHSVHEFTHVEDSKILRTLHYLLLKPGKLTTEYFAGRKIRYISPIRMFLIIFAITFYVYSAFKTVAIYDVEAMAKSQAPLSAQLDKVADKKNISRNELVQAINQNWQRYTSLSQLSYVVLFGLILKLGFQKRFLVEHLVFSLHFISFSLLLSVLLWPLYLLSGGIALNSINIGISLLTLIITGFCLSLAVKEMYEQTWRKAIISATWMVVAYFVVYIFVYTLTFAMAIRNAV